mmetsp:Transcript_9028/g.14605  ORF Transcript_9028/g.14605 Transcript_9028/m.14605 type:complete len:87 (+) Transcript_9028:65-325(+)
MEALRCLKHTSHSDIEVGQTMALLEASFLEPTSKRFGTTSITVQQKHNYRKGWLLSHARKLSLLVHNIKIQVRLKRDPNTKNAPNP